MSPREVLQSLDEDLAKAEAEKEEMMVIGGSEDEDYDTMKMNDRLSTLSLEQIEERDRRRRISFCTSNVNIG